jgi:UDP-2,4-diacetamido-2,4,6-trideoxy-beta-L-altropyranose hydrolase
MLVRADAGVGIGTGHVMRCLALAQAWRDRGGPVAFATNALPEEIEKRLAAEGIDLLRLDEPPGGASDARRTAEFGAAIGAAWAVVDGYGFMATYRRTLRQSGLRLLLLEDIRGERSAADVILNPTPDAASPASERTEASPRLLLGTAYVPLRREFRRWRGWSRPAADPAARILLTMGGSDPDNATLTALRAIERLHRTGLEVRVVVGPANPHGTVLARQVETLRFDVRLERPSEAMPDLMAWADLAITAAGSTCWELAFMGVPMIAVVLAENQRRIAESLCGAGAAVSAGWADVSEPGTLAAAIDATISSRQAREQMSRCGRDLVDGLGAERATGELQAAFVEGAGAR